MDGRLLRLSAAAFSVEKPARFSCGPPLNAAAEFAASVAAVSRSPQPGLQKALRDPKGGSCCLYGCSCYLLGQRYNSRRADSFPSSKVSGQTHGRSDICMASCRNSHVASHARLAQLKIFIYQEAPCARRQVARASTRCSSLPSLLLLLVHQEQCPHPKRNTAGRSGLTLGKHLEAAEACRIFFLNVASVLTRLLLLLEALPPDFIHAA